MSAVPAGFALLAGMLLVCAGCATAPSGGGAAESTAPAVMAPSSTRVLGQATLYLSAIGERLEVIHDTATGIAIVKLPGGGMAALPEEIAGSEGRYRDSRMTLWENEGAGLLWIDGKLVFTGKVAD